MNKNNKLIEAIIDNIQNNKNCTYFKQDAIEEIESYHNSLYIRTKKAFEYDFYNYSIYDTQQVQRLLDKVNHKLKLSQHKFSFEKIQARKQYK